MLTATEGKFALGMVYHVPTVGCLQKYTPADNILNACLVPRGVLTSLHQNNRAHLLILTAFFIFALSSNAFAQDDNKMALGVGLEWNMNTYYYFAGAASVGVDFDLFRSFATGFSAVASRNVSVFTTLEPAAMFRWYPWGKNHTGLFAQADAGAFIFMEDERTVPMFLGGLRIGLRLPLGRFFYIEPYGRGGYPFAFGIGLTGGTRFSPLRKETTTPPPEPVITPQVVIEPEKPPAPPPAPAPKIAVEPEPKKTEPEKPPAPPPAPAPKIAVEPEPKKAEPVKPQTPPPVIPEEPPVVEKAEPAKPAQTIPESQVETIVRKKEAAPPQPNNSVETIVRRRK